MDVRRDLAVFALHELGLRQLAWLVQPETVPSSGTAKRPSNHQMSGKKHMY